MIAIFYLTGARDYLTLETIQKNLSDLKDINSRRPVMFLSLFFGTIFILTTLSIPGTIVLTLLAGSLFGVFRGTLIVVAANTLGAGGAFLLSRYLFRESLKKKFQSQFQKMEKRVQERGKSYLFILRIVPISPFVLINLLVGLTKFPLWSFLWITFVGMIPGSFVYVFAGKEIAKINHASDILTPTICVSLLLISFLPLLLRKVLSHFQNDQETYDH